MRETDAVPIARALDGSLSIFRSVGDQLLLAVRYSYFEFDEGQPVGSPMLERIWFDFEHGSLEISTESDDDTINLAYLSASKDGKRGVDVSKTDPWKSLVGKPFGWGWIIVNQQGYCDGALLSFEGIRPQTLLTVMASSLQVASISAG